MVVPALLKAGLPATSVEPLLTALSSGSKIAIDQVPGVSNSIIAVASTMYKAAYSKSFQTVFLASIAFGAIAFIASFWAPNLDGMLTTEVLRKLEDGYATKKQSHEENITAIESGISETKELEGIRLGVRA